MASPTGQGSSNGNTTLQGNNGLASSIEKLEGVSNFLNWKFAIKMLLTMDGLWNTIEGTETDPVRDQRALARIALCIKPALYQYIRNATTAKEAWKSLADIFENKGLLRRVLLLRQLHRIDYTQFSSMSEYIQGVMTLVQQLTDIGRKTDDAEVAEILLSGLPQEFEYLVSNLETVCLTSNLTSEIVRTRLLQEELRRNDGASNTNNTALVAKNSFKKKSIICHYCSKPGHVKAKCYKMKNDQKKSDQKDSTSFASALFVHQNDAWFIDSGCTSHMTNYKEDLVNYKDFNCKLKNTTVAVANNEKLKCSGMGNLMVNFGTEVRQLENVLFVPQLATNLISVSKLVESGLTVEFNSHGCSIYDSKVSGNRLALVGCKNGIYKISCNIVKPLHNKVYSSKLLSNGQKTESTAVAVSTRLWHRRLGHLGLRGMCTLKGHVSGVMFQDSQDSLKDCIPCLEGKLSTQPFPKGEGKRSERPLELVHSDVCGPMSENSLGGAKYLVTFTDDHTRKTFGYLMKCKSEVMSKFIIFKAMVERQTGLKIKCLRSDNGGEYVNFRFSGFLNKEGIIHQTTVPYSAQQNGVSERLNRTLIEKARCMLQESGLSKRYWGEAVNTAIYLKNRSPTTALDGQIPEHLWSGSKVDLSHLKVFGCIAYSLEPKHKRGKLDAKSKRYIFVGYSETCKGYRLSDPMNPRKIVLSRNVAFLESRFYDDNIDDREHDDYVEINLLNNNFERSTELVLNNDNLNNNNTNEIHSSQNNLDECSNLDSISNKTNSLELNDGSRITDTTDEEHYCTGSEDESRCADSSSASHESVTSLSPDAPVRGEGVTSVEVPRAEANTRPVRSTRSIPPLRYCDYDISMYVSNFEEPSCYEEAVSCSDATDWRAAMKSEYDSLIANEVWKIVDRPIGQNVIKSKWVFKRKHDASGNFSKFKARLVARGFSQKQGIDYNDTFSPVVRHSTMRILFSLANDLNLSIDHIDVACAFLNGNLNETIFMEQPIGFDNGDTSKVCLLNKSIYGLKQAGKMWNSKVHDLLNNNGYVQSLCEPCVYVKKEKHDLTIIALYVDDFFIFYTEKSVIQKDLVKLLQKEFNVKNLGPLKSCLGINVTRDRSKCILKLDQTDYIKKLLLRFGMGNCKTVSTPMPLNCKLLKAENVSEGNDNFRQLLGSLMYLAVCTRPDIAYACSQLSQFNNCHDNSHWQAAKRVLRYLAGTINYSLLFVRSNKLSLAAYTDADWANDVTDRKSYTGYIVKLGNNTINWESRKQRCVALSTTEAEYLSICDVCKDISFIKNLLSEIFCLNVETVVYNDNQSAIKLLECKEYCHKRTKHIDLRYHYVKDLIRNNIVIVKYLQTEGMIADVLTKPLSCKKHVDFIKDMNVCVV